MLLLLMLSKKILRAKELSKLTMSPICPAISFGSKLFIFSQINLTASSQFDLTNLLSFFM